MEAQASLEEKTFYLSEYWTDHEQFQMRIPQKLTFPEARGFSFPQEQLSTSADLRRLFSDFHVISWSKLQVPPLWLWLGTNPDGGPEGLVSADAPNKFGRFRLPFLGRTSSDWAHQEKWHPVDRFLSDGPEGLVILGEEMLDGLQTLRVEKRLEPETSPEGNPVPYRFARAWLDPRRGYLPLRLEHSRRIPEDPDRPANEIITLTDIRDIGGGFYYPFVTRREIVDARSRLYIDPNYIDGTPLAPEDMYITEIETWETLSVSLEPIPDPKMFLVGLPDDAIYSDTTQRRFLIKGDPEAAIDALMSRTQDPRIVDVTAPAKIQPEIEGRNPAIWLWLALINVVIAALAVFYFRSNFK